MGEKKPLNPNKVIMKTGFEGLGLRVDQIGKSEIYCSDRIGLSGYDSLPL